MLERRHLAMPTLAAVLLAAAGVALLIEGRTAIPLGAALFVAFPLSLAVLLLLLPVRYLCRALPVHETSALRLFLTHGAGAILMGVASQSLGEGLASLGARSWGAQVHEVYLLKSVPVAYAGALVYLLGVSRYYVLLGVEATRRAEQRSMELSVLAREAELRALRAQVHPHFLFNSLNSISALVSTDAAQAREMCVLLAEFFRKTLAVGEKPWVTLEEELSIARTYLSIEQVRLGTRLSVEERVGDDARACILPPLLLQPLVENAIRHGIAGRQEGGVLRIEAHMEAERLLIRIDNPFDPDAPRRAGVGLGLTNVRRRLLAAYGERARVEVEMGAEAFGVAIAMPAEAQA